MCEYADASKRIRLAKVEPLGHVWGVTKLYLIALKNTISNLQLKRKTNKIMISDHPQRKIKKFLILI